jgi:hypothetical protein
VTPSAWDESSEDEVVRCLECGTEIDQDCPHLLLLADVTFGRCTGGVACDFWDGYSSQVSEVFAKCLKDGSKPSWAGFAVGDVWRDMHLDPIDDPDHPSLPTRAFINLIVEVLSDAGGTEHMGSLVACSGAFAESAIRVMYASDPKATCERGREVLAEWLLPENPRRRRR